MTDKQEFAVIIGRLFLACNMEASEPLVSVYWEALSDLPVADIQRAVAEVIKTQTTGHKPVPGQIRQLALGNVEAAAMNAWQALNQAIHKYGAYHDPVFTDSAIVAIVQQHGGWLHICGLEVHHYENWFRKSFFSDYETIRNHAGRLKQLTGLSTAANKSIENEKQWLAN